MARDDTHAPASSSPWSSSLPPKVAAAVLRRLPSHLDRVRFAAVCRPWRAATKHQPRLPLPWLALPDGTFFSFPGSAALRFPDVASAAAAAGYHGSCGDWLLFDGVGDGYLLANPFSGDTMRLPGLSRVRFDVGDGAALAWRGITDDWRAPAGTTVRKLVMCPGGRVVAAMVGDGRVGKIAMCRAGAGSLSSSWVVSGHDVWRGITDIAFYDGKVYAVEDTGDLLAMPTGEDSRTGEPAVAWARPVIKASHATPARRRKKAPPPATRYLFVCGGRLMMVHRAITGDGVTKFAVFKADLVSARWSEVRSVGDDTTLFVGRWCTLARRVSAYELPGNRIHFLDDDAFPRGCPGSFGSYDMGDGKIYPLMPPLELCNGAGDTPATWLFPSEQEVLSWRDLPSDVIDLVLRRLCSRDDRLNLSEVCRDWCASARKNLRRRPRARAPTVATVAPPPAVAYLAFPNGTMFRFPDLTSSLPDKKVAGFIGAACDDWLVFHDDGGLFRLTSPFTGKTRLLPSFDGVRAHDGPVQIVNDLSPSLRVVTSQRRDYEAMAMRKLVVCPDGGFIAAIFGGAGEYLSMVALCSLETFSWSSHSAGDRWWRYEYDDLVLFGGRLHALTASENLLAFDVGVDGGTGQPFVSRVERVVEGDRRCPNAATLRYLVPSDGGDLLMVRRQLLHAREGRSRTPRFAVFRADLESSRWEAVSSLDRGEALFVGRRCSRAVRGPRFLPGGQIFFLPDESPSMWEPRRRGGHHAAVYRMLDGKVTDMLPRQRQDDGPVPQATWLFSTMTGYCE